MPGEKNWNINLTALYPETLENLVCAHEHVVTTQSVNDNFKLTLCLAPLRT